MLLSLLSAPVMANSIPPLPNTFSGTVILNGAEAPVGTEIIAYIDYQNNTNPNGSTNVTIPGHYELHVQGNSADQQKEITFIIDNTTAVQTVEFSIYAPPPTILNLSTTGTSVKISAGKTSLFSDTTNPEDKQIQDTSNETTESLNGFTFILTSGMLFSVFVAIKIRSKENL
jgi:hypothetical protein